MEKNVLVAAKQKQLGDIVSKVAGYNVISTLTSRDHVLSTCQRYRPDILIIAEGTPSSAHDTTTGFLLKLHQAIPDLRIIFLARELQPDDIARTSELGNLVEAGIYDIYCKNKISVSIIAELLSLPKTFKEVSYLLKYKNQYEEDDEFDFDEEEFEGSEISEDLDGFPNVFVISSIKPGTGKSFVATNVAACIATFGKLKENGKQPRVALIEGDLQNLSVGTLLQIEDNVYNIKTALDAIATVVDDEGNVSTDANERAVVNERVLKCFQPYAYSRNLYALVGSQLRMEEMEDVSPYHYYYLIQTVAENFDVVIIDSNSSLQHVTTLPILQLAHTCYYILNLDFNNIRNNARYRETLVALDLAPKLRYILNEDINEESAANYAEKLHYDSNTLKEAGFQIVCKIPQIDKSIFLNRLYDGIPVCLDKTFHTLKAREEICKISNEIYPLDNEQDLHMERIEYNKQKGHGPKKKRKGFFRR